MQSIAQNCGKAVLKVQAKGDGMGRHTSKKKDSPRRSRARPSPKRINAAVASLHMVLLKIEEQDLPVKQTEALAGPVLCAIQELQALLP